MKISELITYLQTLDPDTTVYMTEFDFNGDTRFDEVTEEYFEYHSPLKNDYGTVIDKKGLVIL